MVHWPYHNHGILVVWCFFRSSAATVSKGGAAHSLLLPGMGVELIVMSILSVMVALFFLGARFFIHLLASFLLWLLNPFFMRTLSNFTGWLRRLGYINPSQCLRPTELSLQDLVLFLHFFRFSAFAGYFQDWWWTITKIMKLVLQIFQDERT